MCGERLGQVASALHDAGLLGPGPPAVRLLVLGTGDAPTARSVLAEAGLAPGPGVTLAVDPTGAAYAELGFHRGVGRTLALKRRANVVGALLFPLQCCVRRRVPFVNAGDPWQQGGVLVFAGPSGGSGGGTEVFALREESPGWPELDAGGMVRAVTGAMRRGGVTGGDDGDAAGGAPLLGRNGGGVRRRG
jgi:hypothetical protein